MKFRAYCKTHNRALRFRFESQAFVFYHEVGVFSIDEGSFYCTGDQAPRISREVCGEYWAIEPVLEETTKISQILAQLEDAEAIPVTFTGMMVLREAEASVALDKDETFTVD